MDWKDFEDECLEFLNSKYSKTFEPQGRSYSTVSDILFKGLDKEFYIETKMSKAQCGQFVLLPDEKEKVFKYSYKNKTKENEYTKEIINYMNSNFYAFSNSGTAGKEIDLPKSVFYNWIIDYYKTKAVEFILTKDKNSFVVIPLANLPIYFDVTAKYRVKKSGSAKLTTSNKQDCTIAMQDAGINFTWVGLEITSETNLDGIRVKGDNFDYLIKASGSRYTIRKLSNTKNANVIFTIRLIPYSHEQQVHDLLSFEEYIR